MQANLKAIDFVRAVLSDNPNYFILEQQEKINLLYNFALKDLNTDIKTVSLSSHKSVEAIFVYAERFKDNWSKLVG